MLEAKKLPWLVWGLAAAYFFVDYSARVSHSVMLPELQQAFGVSAAGLGILSSYFYYPYVVMQIPVGLTVDRYSVRGILTIMALLTGVGCVLFGLADVIYVAQLGRFLIGFSAAFAFISALKLASEWFPPQRLGLLAGLTQALGMLGAAAGGLPVSFAVSTTGWRGAMYSMSVVFVFLAILIYKFVRDHPPHVTLTKAQANQGLSIWQSLGIVIRNPQSWLNALYAGLLFAPTAILGELWGVSYLQFGQGFSAHEAAFVNSLIFIGWGVGGPLTGWFSDRIGKRKPVIIASAIAGALIMAFYLYTPNLSKPVACCLMFLFGLTNTGVAMAYAVAAEINPRPVIGASMAFTNMMSVIIGAALQPVVGKLLDLRIGGMDHDLSQYQLADFQAALWLVPICAGTACLLACLIQETHCRLKEGAV